MGILKKFVPGCTCCGDCPLLATIDDVDVTASGTWDDSTPGELHTSSVDAHRYSTYDIGSGTFLVETTFDIDWGADWDSTDEIEVRLIGGWDIDRSTATYNYLYAAIKIKMVYIDPPGGWYTCAQFVIGKRDNSGVDTELASALHTWEKNAYPEQLTGTTSNVLTLCWNNSGLSGYTDLVGVAGGSFLSGSDQNPWILEGYNVTHPTDNVNAKGRVGVAVKTIVGADDVKFYDFTLYETVDNNSKCPDCAGSCCGSISPDTATVKITSIDASNYYWTENGGAIQLNCDAAVGTIVCDLFGVTGVTGSIEKATDHQCCWVGEGGSLTYETWDADLEDWVAQTNCGSLLIVVNVAYDIDGIYGNERVVTVEVMFRAWQEDTHENLVDCWRVGRYIGPLTTTCEQRITYLTIANDDTAPTDRFLACYAAVCDPASFWSCGEYNSCEVKWA